MRTFCAALQVSMVAFIVTPTVHAQTSPVGATTVSSAAPLPSAPPPSEPASQPAADTTVPSPAAPPTSSAVNEPAPPPPTPAASAVEQQRPAPPPAPSWRSTPGPSIWGPAAKPQPFIQRWYGWQTLIAVGSADTLMAASIPGPLAYAMIIGVPVHIMAGPINHWAHGNTGRGFAALGMNLAPPIVGYLAGGVIGLIPGLFVGPIVDIAFLSTTAERVRHVSAQGAPAFMPSSMAIVPMIDANRKGFSIVGQF